MSAFEVVRRVEKVEYWEAVSCIVAVEDSGGVVKKRVSMRQGEKGRGERTEYFVGNEGTI